MRRIDKWFSSIPPVRSLLWHGDIGRCHAIDPPGNDERIITLHPRARVKPLAEPTKCTD
jgi:hypothetical protein